ncbi:MAG: LemA family protein [Candidatus Methanomethylicaceae archaeon]
MKAKIAAGIVIIISITSLVSFAAIYFSTYNKLVALKFTVDEKWAQVEQELQRRYDLIPNIVSVARAYITYEGSILQNVTALRSQWMSALKSGDMDIINNATNQIELGIRGLIATFEAYPELRSSEVIQSLMITLEGTENRISTERMRFNEAVRDYNTAIQSFPANLWAGSWGFTLKSYFKAQVGSAEVPQVEF